MIVPTLAGFLTVLAIVWLDERSRRARNRHLREMIEAEQEAWSRIEL